MPELVVPWTEIRFGLVSGLAFNPVASIAVVLLAGALAGTENASRGRLVAAYVVVVVGWVVGDGLAAGEGLASVPEAWSAWYPLSWALVGLLAGYVVPVLVGRYVGTRVTHGTGWLSTMAVGVAVSLAFAACGTLTP